MTTIFDTHHPETVKAALLEPVLCTDCQTYVPLGWIDQVGGVMVQCPAAEMTRGHRAMNAALMSVLDRVANAPART